ncbi:uncharacterized protein FOBCDRAFT_226552 [Fusarium oxysporum Fo47]|uniref:C3H1-type domain-containing protein n=1 Tax=Fusarium oxysporum Fo47 TaxID=660027 RepID=W9K7E1_FUSOX|nr:uncharacterized protein FOBCDRAFT_226552 [Fusarium oxysporum Fo47]EWZ40231.1 hypothetical protein FOZG_09015 [Fusarium oxysporum Fo47]QKD56244.2 hypothetical protein FOBCDRAFT_226552 [Fusarium oxysporum Fo47]
MRSGTSSLIRENLEYSSQMSRYVYGHGAAQGYQTSQPYAYSANESYNPALYHNDAAGTQPAHGQGVAEAYEYNQTAIPGLGMRFSHDTANWQPTLPQNIPDTQIDSTSAMTTGVTTKPDDNDASSHSITYNSRSTIAMDVDKMEEGELSEGELEDIYEPSGIDGPDAENQGSQPPDSTAAKHHTTKNLQNNHDAEKRASNSKQLGRERSGSYSPYLSPREIESNGSENGGSNTRNSRVANDLKMTESATVMKTTNDNGGEYSSSPRPDARHIDSIISESKKRAEKAILHLWPLNVRYHNYIEEGIDRALLDELFEEMGLDLEATTANQGEAKRPSMSKVAKVPSNTLDQESPSTVASTATTGPRGVEQMKDKSEERKDRIARLLAAKGSKTTVGDTDNTKPTYPMSLLPGNTKTDKTKSQSEKSKLIQQKMEALIKAREANAKAAPQAHTPSEPHLPLPVTETSRSQSLARADSMNIDEQTEVNVEVADPATAPSIPGLFLSSNAPSPVPHQRKRPVAADLNENSTAMSHKRPFGQTRESRPFLIDVSDDEDDAEMEIDSPELRPSSIQRPMTPGSRTASFRDHPALLDSASRRAASSPKTAGTPTTSANGMYDLESMNKKIEDMKRKIAEAEARKKAKQSGNNSPLPQSGSPSKEGSVDVPTPPAPAVRRAVSTNTEVVQGSPASSVHHSPRAIAKLPKARDQSVIARPSLRARVASERLPILEARRRAQAEQLKHLYSEAARLEKEIQNSLAEEERLKEDAAENELNPSTPNESELEDFQRDSLDMVTNAQRSSQETNSKETLTELAENEKMNLSYDEVEPDASMDEASSIESTNNKETIDEPLQGELRELENHRTRETTVPGSHSALAARSSITHNTVNISGDPAMNGAEEAEEDVAMEEADTSSEEEDTDDYEPTHVGIRLPDPQSPASWHSSPFHAPLDHGVLETSDTDMQGMATTTPITQPISTGDGDTESETHREAEAQKALRVCEKIDKTTFVPYETPLQYFRAYRFHPQYSGSVAGGLRSLTYSNKIDVTREVCPDQLIEGACPRGSECQFQHFENMQVPDDQILLQLGAYGNCEAEQHDQYVEGLRELLTDFRKRKVKDFDAISNGIIEYRAKFLGDKTKILPLGAVTL